MLPNHSRHLIQSLQIFPYQKLPLLSILDSLISQEETRLLALSSSDTGIIELWAVSQKYLKTDPSPIEDPVFSYNTISEKLLTSGHASSGYEVSAVVRVISNDDLRRILMIALYLILGYAGFTLFILCMEIFLGRMKQKKKAPRRDKKKDTQKNTSEKKIPVQEDERLEQNFKAPALSEGQIWPVELLKLRLSNEIERSAENEADIGFIVFRLGKVYSQNNKLLKRFEKILLENFRYADMLYHLDPYYYGTILPNRGAAECLKEIEHFLRICKSVSLSTKEIYIGYSTRSGRLMSGDRLFKESLKSASRANPDRGRIINFKPDPYKYQTHLLGIPLAGNEK